MTAVSVDFRSKDLPSLKLDAKDVKPFVSGAPKGFDEVKPEVQHRLVTTKRHFFYNRQVASVRAVNRTALKFADVELESPVEQLTALHFESTTAVALLRDGSVVAIAASDMPDKTVKVSLAKLVGDDKKIANATAICVLQSQSTSHSTSNVWTHKQIVVFSGGDKKDQPLTITRIVPAADGASADKVETVVAANAWAGTFGAVTFASAGQNGFVAICGSNGGKVQVVHQADLAKGVLAKPLTPHNEIGAQSAIFLPRDTVTSDADPTLAASSATDAIMTTAKGGHEIRLWGLSGKAVTLIQTIAIAGDKDNGDRENIVEGSTFDMTFLISKNSGVNGTIIAIEPDTDRTGFRRITEWELPEAQPILSCSACPAPSTGVSAQASRFCLFVRTDKGVFRYTFDSRISGAANVVSSSSAAAAADDQQESGKAAAAGGDNVSKWFGGGAAAASESDPVDPAIVSKSSKEVVSVKAGQRTTTVEGTSSKDVKAAVDAAVSEATQQHLVSAGRFYEQSDAVVQSLEQALGQALGALRIPAVRQRSNDVAAEWARKAVRTIEDAVRTAVANSKKSEGGAAASSSSNTAGPLSIAGFSPTLAQNFYNSFLENIHAASSTVVDHSLEKLLDAAISQAVDKAWPSIQNAIDAMTGGSNGQGNQIPRVTALPSFTSFSESIQADQARQNQAVKRQVDQNKRDLSMYESTTGGNTKAAEQYFARLQSAVQGLHTAIEAAKAPVTIGNTSAVTPANEDEVFGKVQKMAAEGSFLAATNIIANGGSLSLITRFFDCAEVASHFEACCSPKGMSPASAVTILRLLSRGLTSAPAVALASRVHLIKKITVPYALFLEEEADTPASKDALAFFKNVSQDIEDAMAELARVQGADRNTLKFAKLAGNALSIFINEEQE